MNYFGNNFNDMNIGMSMRPDAEPYYPYYPGNYGQNQGEPYSTGPTPSTFINYSPGPMFSSATTSTSMSSTTAAVSQSTSHSFNGYNVTTTQPNIKTKSNMYQDSTHKDEETNLETRSDPGCPSIFDLTTSNKVETSSRGVEVMKTPGQLRHLKNISNKKVTESGTDTLVTSGVEFLQQLHAHCLQTEQASEVLFDVKAALTDLKQTKASLLAQIQELNRQKQDHEEMIQSLSDKLSSNVRSLEERIIRTNSSHEHLENKVQALSKGSKNVSGFRSFDNEDIENILLRFAAFGEEKIKHIEIVGNGKRNSDGTPIRKLVIEDQLGKDDYPKLSVPKSWKSHSDSKTINNNFKLITTMFNDVVGKRLDALESKLDKRISQVEKRVDVLHKLVNSSLTSQDRTLSLKQNETREQEGPIERTLQGFNKENEVALFGQRVTFDLSTKKKPLADILNANRASCEAEKKSPTSMSSKQESINISVPMPQPAILEQNTGQNGLVTQLLRSIGATTSRDTKSKDTSDNIFISANNHASDTVSSKLNGNRDNRGMHVGGVSSQKKESFRMDVSADGESLTETKEQENVSDNYNKEYKIKVTKGSPAAQINKKYKNTNGKSKKFNPPGAAAGRAAFNRSKKNPDNQSG